MIATEIELRAEQSVRLGPGIRLVVVAVGRSDVKIGIQASRDIPVVRPEAKVKTPKVRCPEAKLKTPRAAKA